MQIKQTGQPIPVSKVETDRREEVKKIKPIGSQQIPDSFETGKAGSSQNQSNAASAEPESKAGQNTGRILINQLTQARLADAGIKLANPSATENTGTRDLTDIQQGQVEATSPQVNTKGNPRTPGATTDYGPRVPEGAYTGDARSNMEKNKGALADFFAQQNIDVPSSGNGVDASDFGVGQGVDLGNGFNTGQGPGDPMDNVNDQFARRDYLNGVGNAGNRLASQMQEAAQGSDGAGRGHGKDMISDDSDGGMQGAAGKIIEGGGATAGLLVGADSAVKAAGAAGVGGAAFLAGGVAAGASGLIIGTGVDKVITEVNGQPLGDELAAGSTARKEILYVAAQKAASKNAIEQQKEEARVKAAGQNKIIIVNGRRLSAAEVEQLEREKIADEKKKSGNASGSSGTSGSSGSSGTAGTGGGTKTAEDRTQENYDRGKVKQADELLKNLGMDGIWNLQRGPKNQGKGPDYGPEHVGTSVEAAGNGSLLLSQFGKDGLVGNPNQQNHDGAGPSNFGGLPGSTNSDPLDGSNYNGVTRDEEVDVSVQTGIKENVDDDDEEKRKLIRNPDFKPATNYSQFKKH